MLGVALLVAWVAYRAELWEYDQGDKARALAASLLDVADDEDEEEIKEIKPKTQLRIARNPRREFGALPCRLAGQVFAGDRSLAGEEAAELRGGIARFRRCVLYGKPFCLPRGYVLIQFLSAGAERRSVPRRATAAEERRLSAPSVREVAERRHDASRPAARSPRDRLAPASGP